VVAVEGYVPREALVWDSDGDTRQFGFALLDGKAFPVWPENELAIRAFLKVRTQWIRDSGFPTGLDGAAVEPKLKRFARVRKLSQDDEDRVFEAIDLMESIIVAEWAKDAKRRDSAARGRARR